ncbi:hypothetical protein, partial [Candidatus Caldatribacterium sp.]|uniref:hypothetical protein n=1 Tax=Candidatus Caldatribacterium sp. TaxID=2282143 RepID=UPI00383F1FCB|nr:hypothetical protein [Candidatus Caldatribacterium sp.]
LLRPSRVREGREVFPEPFAEEEEGEGVRFLFLLGLEELLPEEPWEKLGFRKGGCFLHIHV